MCDHHMFVVICIIICVLIIYRKSYTNISYMFAHICAHMYVVICQTSYVCQSYVCNHI